MKTTEVIEGLRDMARQMNECAPSEEATHAAEVLEEAADIITYNMDNGGLSLDEYQHRAIRTCTPSCYNYHYMMGNLVAEVGEASGKVAKAIRKGEGAFVDGVFTFTANADDNVRLLKCELGDILWQLAGLCTVQGWSLEEVAEMNLRKLADRKQRGVIIGNGDER